MTDKCEFVVRKIFLIPDWYIISAAELSRLFSYCIEASSADQANLFRELDCSAIYDERSCYFCSGVEKLCCTNMELPRD